MSVDLVQCYHLGCQQLFDLTKNTITSCVYHPGAPFFHDAYKGWSCCKRKCVDFTEFLNIKGCTTGYHSNEKPPEPEKKVNTDVNIDVPEPVRPPIVAKERPDVSSPMTELQPTVSETLKKVVYTDAKPVEQIPEEKEVQIGNPCLHNGCKTKYGGPATDSENCQYHPGVPIFHEGYKYWSCCKKKTTEFEVFENQKGCTTGSHKWKKDAGEIEEAQNVKCRMDWIQTGANVTVILYAKKCHPGKSRVSLNGVKLDVNIFFPEENGFYKNTWVLAGIVDPSRSTVTMTPTKVEITMKKAEPVHWSNLDIPHEKLKAMEQLRIDACKSVGVEPVDLSDI